MKREARYQKGDKIGGRYQVHQLLIGGMGEVYLCLDEQEKIPIALKTFQYPVSQHSLKQVNQFKQEVETWIQLGYHSNIVYCFWMQSIDSQPFIGLEWVQNITGIGTSLREHLYNAGKLSVRQATDFILDTCNALIHVHQVDSKFLHRDLKPENILINHDNRAKITDFGLAILSSLHPSGITIAGTPLYMAPEQWDSKQDLDIRTDIYALGCIFYELLTGVPVFHGRTIAEIQAQHQKHAPNLDLIPVPFRSVIATCLEKDKSKRFTQPKELFDTLQKIYLDQWRTQRQFPKPEEQGYIDYQSRAVTYTELRQFDRAIADYEQAFLTETDHTPIYISRANTYAYMKQYDLALGDLKKIKQHIPEALMIRSKIFLETGKLKDSIRECDELLKIQPNNARTYYNRAMAYHLDHQHKQAIADFNKAISINPRMKEAYGNRAVVFAEQGQLDNALADFNQSLALDPLHVLSITERAKLYMQMGQYENALAGFNHAIELIPDDAETYYNRGVVHLTLKHIPQALDDWEYAIKLNPQDKRAQFNLGVTLVRCGLLEQAKNHLTIALQLGVSEAKAALEHLDAIYAHFGEDLSPFNIALVALLECQTKQDVETLVLYIPSMIDDEFAMDVEDVMNNPHNQPSAFNRQQLQWLKQIINEGD